MGKENIKLNKKQIDEIVDLMKKEELIELEEQIEKALEKGTQDNLEMEKLKQDQTIQKQGKETVKSNSPITEEKKRNDQTESVSVPGAAAMSASPRGEPQNVTDPVDKKDNSKKL